MNEKYGALIWAFLKIGAQTFGGGYAMLPILDREIIQKKGWVTLDEVMDYYAVAQVTPGVIAINTATFIGNRVKGKAGGILATLSFMLPGTLFMIIIGLCLHGFADIPAAGHAFAGIRVAVSALVLRTVVKLMKTSLQNGAAVVIMLLVFALTLIFNPFPALLIVPAGICGFFIYNPGRRGAKNKVNQ